MKKLYILALVALIAATTLFINNNVSKADDGPKSFYGTVTYGGDALVNAIITITNTQTQQQYTAQSNGTGYYAFGTDIPGGTYNLKALKDAPTGGYYIGNVSNKVYCPDDICVPVLVNIVTHYVEDPN